MVALHPALAAAEQDVDYEHPGEGQAPGHDHHVGRRRWDEVVRSYPPAAAEELDRPHDERETPEDGQRYPEQARGPGRTYLRPDPLDHQPEGDEANPGPHPSEQRPLVGQVLSRLGSPGPPPDPSSELTARPPLRCARRYWRSP